MSQAMFRRNRLIEYARYLNEQQNSSEKILKDRPEDQYTLGMTANAKINLEHFCRVFGIELNEVQEEAAK